MEASTLPLTMFNLLSVGRGWSMGSLHNTREETLSMSTRLLEGERSLVTGCAGGIGRGIAKALLAEGAAVLGSDIAAPPPEDGIDFLAADLGKRDGWKILLEGAIKKLGTI